MRQPPVALADDPARQGLGVAVEADVGDAGVGLGAGRQRGQHHRLVGLPQSEQHPAGFLLAAGLGPVAGVFLEQRVGDAVREEDAPQGAAGRRRGEVASAPESVAADAASASPNRADRPAVRFKAVHMVRVLFRWAAALSPDAPRWRAGRARGTAFRAASPPPFLFPIIPVTVGRVKVGGRRSASRFASRAPRDPTNPKRERGFRPHSLRSQTHAADLRCPVFRSAEVPFFALRRPRENHAPNGATPGRTPTPCWDSFFRALQGRVGGGVAPAASHRSGRAQLRHPVRPVMASPARGSLSVGVTWTRSRVQSPRRVSPPRVRDGQPPSLHGVPAGQVPLLPRYYEVCDSLRPSRRASFPSRGATRRLRLSSSSLRPRTHDRGPGVRTGPPRRAVNVWRPSGPPKFPGNPHVPTPCSSTPAGPLPQALRHRHGPRIAKTKAPREEVISGLNRTASALAVYASPDGSVPRRKTRFWLLAKLYQAGLATRRVPTKGFRDVQLHRFPLSRAFLVATPTRQGPRGPIQ